MRFCPEMLTVGGHTMTRMTSAQCETFAEQMLDGVCAQTPVSATASAKADGFDCLPAGKSPPRTCRKTVFYAVGDQRDQEWDCAVRWAREKLRECGVLDFDESNVLHIARALLLPRRAFAFDARLCSGDIQALRELHPYAPEHAMLTRMCELTEVRLRVVNG